MIMLGAGGGGRNLSFSNYFTKIFSYKTMDIQCIRPKLYTRRVYMYLIFFLLKKKVTTRQLHRHRLQKRIDFLWMKYFY